MSALVPVALTTCPCCGRPHPSRQRVDEPAMLRHGGYGAERSTTTLGCPCGWSLVIEVVERRPPR